MSRYVSPVETITDGNGAPMVGAELAFYATGTATLKTIYSDPALSVPMTNPVKAISSGAGAIYPNIYLDGVYKVEQQDDSGIPASGPTPRIDGVVLWTRDPVGVVAAGNFEVWNSGAVYNIPDVVYASNDKYYISLVDTNQGNEPSVSPSQWQLIPVSTMAGTDKANAFTGINTFSAAQILSKGADIASATALSIGADGNYFDVTGTATITSISTVGVGAVIKLHFDGALTLTHHATDLVLPGAANITTAAGDEAEFVEYATGDWRLVNYQKYIIPIDNSYLLTILDTPEVLGSAVTQGAWVTIDSATLNAAKAKKAIVRIWASDIVGSATQSTITLHVRKTGSADAKSQQNEIGVSQIITSAATAHSHHAIGETTINLDANYDFDYYGFALNGTDFTSVLVMLVGYYV